MLAHALAAINRGFHIFPVAQGGKVPHRLSSYRDASGADHGWGETATNDPNRVIQFWTKVDPNANIGVACKPSNLLVVDLDIAKEDSKLRGTDWEYLHTVYGPRVDGEDLFDEMEYKLGEGDRFHSSSAYQVRTGSGGRHLYFHWPASWPRISQASPVKGIVDVRGNGGQWGGYVLAEGSRTEAGEYKLIGGSSVGLPPVWLRQLVAERPAPPKIRRPQGLRQPGAVSWTGLVESVRNAGEGNRNNALVWAARTVCEEGGTEQQALQELGSAAMDAGLGAAEVERTIQSAFRTQRYKENR